MFMTSVKDFFFFFKMMEILKAGNSISKLLLEKIICFDKVKKFVAENGICVSLEIIEGFLKESRTSVITSLTRQRFSCF